MSRVYVCYWVLLFEDHNLKERNVTRLYLGTKLKKYLAPLL